MVAFTQDLKQQKFTIDVEPTDLVGYPSSCFNARRPVPSLPTTAFPGARVLSNEDG
jgi:hypothetical protein